MTYADLIIVLILVISSIISVVRGFVKEAISLASWVLAFWVAATFSGKLAILLPDSLSIQSLRVAVSFAVLMLCALLVGGLANFLVSTFVARSGLTGTDRTLGVVFGLLRGVVVVAVLVLLAGLTPITQQRVWTEALLVPHFETVAVWIRSYLPDDIAESFVFSG